MHLADQRSSGLIKGRNLLGSCLTNKQSEEVEQVMALASIWRMASRLLRRAGAGWFERSGVV
jgi:hypothetical protein